MPEGVCFIKTENRIEQHKKMKIECGTPHSVTPLLSVHLDENPLWNDRDVSATSTLVSQVCYASFLFVVALFFFHEVYH